MIILSYRLDLGGTTMNKIIMEIVKHPVKCKLLLELLKCEQTTAKHLSETFSDIPPATLYRYLKKMTADGVLKIVNQTQVRGAMEKTYALAIDLKKEMNDILDNNSGEAYMQAFIQYMLGFAEQFQEYCKKENINIANDKSGFSLVPLYLSDEELDTFMKSYSQITEQYRDNTPTKDRKLRSIGLIIAPPTRK